MTKKMTKIKVRTNEFDSLEVIEAIDYMYGLGSWKEAKRRLEDGEYTREEIYQAIAWYRADGIEPYADKKAWAKNVGLKDVRNDYENLI